GRHRRPGADRAAGDPNADPVRRRRPAAGAADGPASRRRPGPASRAAQGDRDALTGPGPGLAVGLDVGGSRSRGRLWDGGGGLALGEAEPGAANAPAVRPERADREVRALLDRLCPPSGRDAVVAACAGVAGADSPAAREQVEGRLRALLPNARVLVVHDARL